MVAWEDKQNESKSDDIFVFQVIHDLRHPIQAQSSIIDDTLGRIQKSSAKMKPYFDGNLKKFKVNAFMHSRLENLNMIMNKTGLYNGE